ncbi:MAG: D-glycero-beta-D-manno-heptose 1-phosphate adenylyltransferase [Chitinophagaceae bacterium]|nr:D-glycero-beta-D-manno-heptose 1-phosphate adenylyltransferase [Chitinophagaceae bacterium]
MKQSHHIPNKILSRAELVYQSRRWKFLGKKIVFTNGCFDILHQGHMEVLKQAAALGDVLVVGVNSDASVKRLKGNKRPVNNEAFRSLMLASLTIVDAVSVFDEDTPLELIIALEPDILVKGGDYKPEQVAGGEQVIKNGGEVKIIPLVKGYSTTGLIDKIQQL